jgi:hypothetical protein
VLGDGKGRDDDNAHSDALPVWGQKRGQRGQYLLGASSRQ